MGKLHVDPAQTWLVLERFHAAMKMINAVLREAAREKSAFSKKIDTLSGSSLGQGRSRSHWVVPIESARFLRG